MEHGYNKANYWEKVSWLLSPDRSMPCVFLSHKREDKQHCKTIASYLRKVGIDYYLDENDDALQIASDSKDPTLITSSIKKGIRESTHMLVIVSGLTYKSHWVPFEIGYGHATILDKGLVGDEKPDKLKLSVLTLQDISESTLPDYLMVGHLIRGTKGLNHYISSISSNLEKSADVDAQIESHSKYQHPLDSILNWKL